MGGGSGGSGRLESTRAAVASFSIDGKEAVKLSHDMDDLVFFVCSLFYHPFFLVELVFCFVPVSGLPCVLTLDGCPFPCNDGTRILRVAFLWAR